MCGEMNGKGISNLDTYSFTDEYGRSGKHTKNKYSVRIKPDSV